MSQPDPGTTLERARLMHSQWRANRGPAAQWRVSIDVARALWLAASVAGTFEKAEFRTLDGQTFEYGSGVVTIDVPPIDALLGYPLRADGTLPPNSIVLEAEDNHGSQASIRSRQ